MSNKYTSLEEPIGACKDPNIICINELQIEIAKKRQENDDEIVNKWRNILTREYIIQKIIEAEGKRLKRATLLEDYKYPNPTHLLHLFKQSGIDDKVFAMLESSIKFYHHTTDYFEIYITWNQENDDTCCNIL